MAENINITLQKLANSSAKAIQDSVNKANMQGLQFNAKEAATARQWQEKMSMSSHQMEVADLKKAGLNPVLSANSGGAQSYTTSAASGSADSGANAYGSVMSGLMSTLSGLKQSEMSAAAQRYSADRSYHAAELSALAQKYAAEQSAAAQRYAADMSYKTQMDKPQNSVAGLVDKHLKNFGVTDYVGNKIKLLVKNNKLSNLYDTFRSGGKNVTVLSSRGIEVANSIGKYLGFSSGNANYLSSSMLHLIGSAFFHNNAYSFNKLLSLKAGK